MIRNIKVNRVASDQANRVEGARTVEGSIRPNGWSKGLRSPERLGVKRNRTAGVKGLKRSNDLGLRSLERLTMFNK